MCELYEHIRQAILDGDADGVMEGVQTSVDANVPADEILNNALIPAMNEVGELFQAGEYFVPEMLVAARAMQAGLEIIKPFLVDSGIKLIGKVAVGTVQGDLHDIGKNLVAMMMEGNGFEVIDLGTDVSPEVFVEAAKDGADIIGLSALLTTTMPNMEKTIQAIEATGLRNNVIILIGGAPVTAEYATLIGADGYAADAGQAASLARSMIGKE